MSKELTPLENKIADTEYIRKQNAVYDDWIISEQRSIDYTHIAKKHGVTRAQAMQMIEEVNQYFRQSGVAKQIAHDRLAQANRHWDKLIAIVHEAIKDMQDSGKMPDKIASSAKVISEIEAKRIEMLQKTGMLEDYEMGTMLAEAEEKVAAVSELLKQVITKFPETKQFIINGLKDIQDPDRLPEPEVIDGDVV